MCTMEPCSGVYQNIKNGHCYRRFCDLKTFDEAQKACNASGGYLPYVRNSYEDKFLATLAKSEPDYKEERHRYERCFWIGLKLDRKSKKFKWVNGDELGKYRNWHPGRPDDWKGDEDCAHYSFESGYWSQWNDVVCSKKMQYFCEWDSCVEAIQKI